MLLSNAAIKNRTTVLVGMLLIVVAGATSYKTLPREAAPDVKRPVILVTTTYEGVSPEDIETSVTMKIEEELTGLDGVKEIRSSSAEGVSTITVEFLPEVEESKAKLDVKDKVDLARGELPDGAEDPVVTEINIAEFPIMLINISGDISPVRLKAIADRLSDEIKTRVKGVLEVNISGDLEREIRIEIDPDRVAAYGLTVKELYSLIENENVNVSAGGLETAGTRFNVRVPAEFVKPEDIQRLQLGVRDGWPIYLADVAAIRDTFKDPTSFSRLDGRGSLTVSVQKRIGENIVDIADAVGRIVRQFQARSPKGVEFKITLDQSDDIRMMISDLENNIFTGLVLVMGVLVLFMGWRTSMIVALAIPMSMLMSFAVIQLLGYTLNMIVLFSLILALGMLVDNAIVIVENIYRHMQMGCGRREAAMKGTGEVAWPVITSTATTLAAFTPLMFWPGIMGDFMKYLPITLIITLSSSLFVAMVISPTVCSLLAGGRIKKRSKDTRHPFVEAYRRVLGFALRHRPATLATAVGVLASVVVSYVFLGRGVELFPEFDPKRAIINIRCPQGTNIHETDRLARIVERRVEPYRDDLKHLITTVGSAGGKSAIFGGGSSGAHVANLTLLFWDFKDRRRPSLDVVKEVRRDLSDIPGVEIKVETEEAGPPTGEPVTVRIIGEEFKELQRISEQARRMIADVPGLVDLRSDYEASRPELPLRVERDRVIQAYVSTFAVGQFLKAWVFGRTVGTYRQFNDEYDITIRLPQGQRENIEDLLRLCMPNVHGEAVPLSSLGTFDYAGGYGTISRVDQKRVVTLTAGVEGRLGEKVLKDVQKRLAVLALPVGYEIQFAGEKEHQEEAIAFLLKAFFIALLAIVIILVMQFNTLSAPLIIMTTVILSLIGVLSGLLICRMPFGVVMTGIGVISLAGVVVNNAIVLLDYTRKLQRRGMELVAAAVQAGAIRLRPVLLTAVTTILGLVPMATGKSFDIHTLEFSLRSESSQFWSSMAVAVIFGLAFATMLTLVVVPVLYVSLYRLASRFGMGGLDLPGAEAAEVAVGSQDH